MVKEGVEVVLDCGDEDGDISPHNFSSRLDGEQERLISSFEVLKETWPKASRWVPIILFF
jgi:hypothetical protein